MDLPFLTRDFPGIGGTIKSRAEDFFVQEVPAYEPSGEGEHVYCEIQKVGLTTFEAVGRIAKALRVSSREIGYAGLKDARAVTRQVISIRGATEAQVMGMKWPELTVLWAARHGNKLRLGHLAGNRFAIKVRDVTPTDVVKLRPVLALLERRGMPNYFGEQRFGRRGDNDRLGAALLRGDDEGLLKILLGQPRPGVDNAEAIAARSAFDAGDLNAAAKQWPRRGGGMERHVLSRLLKTGNATAAVRSIDEKIRRLWVSALQSRLFNDVVARRNDSLYRLMDRDLAYKHDSGACFLVERAEVEQSRCDAFDISPSGPLLGSRMSQPMGEPLRIEQEAMNAAGLSGADFRMSSAAGKVRGSRRPLRVKPNDVSLAGGVDEHGPHVTVAFTLPAGSFATVLLRELIKAEPVERAAPAVAEGAEATPDEDAPPVS